MTTTTTAVQPSSEITATMREFYARMLGGDADGANDLISWDPSLVFIGSAGEWVDDQESLRSGRLDPGEGLEAGPRPSAWARGDVGWFVDQPTWVFGDGSRADMRMSAVLQREPAGWRIVHAHLSVAVPDNQCVMLQRRWKHGLPG
ncbi:MAG TPA: nuclear transport factor 2 family protein [Candidatus Acidoferrales bacterium]|nr:nuclear transport factor 2 family protein [Candidatus Acidoferrales bacterium]